MTADLKKEIQDYLQELRKHHIPVERVFLYGSAARGTQHEWSDIDLGIVSQPFAPDRIDEMVRLQEIAWYSNPAISPIPLRPEDLDDRFDTIAEAIRREGIEIPLE